MTSLNPLNIKKFEFWLNLLREIDGVGRVAVLLVPDGARSLTGFIYGYHVVDGGFP